MSVAFLCHHFVNFVDLGEIFLSGFGFLKRVKCSPIISVKQMYLCPLWSYAVLKKMYLVQNLNPHSVEVAKNTDNLSQFATASFIV